MTDARIVAIGTAVPPAVVPQTAARDILLAQPGLGRVAQRLIGAAMDGSAIDARRTVIDEFAGLTDASRRCASSEGGAGQASPVFFDAATQRLLHPTTGERNAEYVRRCVPLALEAARAALARGPIAAADVTHVVTVSCTGFFAPGPDVALVRGLGLRPDVRRLNIGFMGCHGAFPGLRAAVDACRAEPTAVVLVVCVELCTLHLRSSEDPDQIVSGTVFGDGAAAAIVASHPRTGLRIDALHSELSRRETEGDLAWSIGDQGFDLVLSSYVPKLLEHEIGAALAPLEPGRSWSLIENWAIHPGGRAILDRTQEALGLSDAQLAPSRAVLREYGNMSSPTVLFVLDRVMRRARPGERVVATAFGPGVTVESALMTVEGGGR
ncbi:type III polyketide synthase [Gryllotalpicola daejeonensis]|uniref:Type III polyketide synthase n=1 Tax=Gryllotalpicola daejeonensis TaxID=993087 RepID=A0ABP7ZIV5_9MICO